MLAWNLQVRLQLSEVKGVFNYKNPEAAGHPAHPVLIHQVLMQ